MPNTPKKETLLVENAILKYNEQVRSMLKEELAPFSASIKELDKRITSVEDEVFNIKDVISPFAAIRKKLWFWLIFISLAVGVAGNNLGDWIGNLFKK